MKHIYRFGLAAVGIMLSFGALTGCSKSVDKNGSVFFVTEEPSPTPSPSPSPSPSVSPSPSPSTSPDPEACANLPFGDLHEVSIFAKTKSVIADSEAESRILAGEFLDLLDVNVGTKESPDANRGDVVGGKALVYKTGKVPNGQVNWGTSVYAKGLHTLGGIKKATPVDFATNGKNLDLLSGAYATLANVGTVDVECTKGAGHACVLNLDGVHSVRNIFNVQPKDLKGIKGINVRIPAGSTALVNVWGKVIAIRGIGISLSSGVEATHVLWNFPDNEGLGLVDVDFPGTILAPKSAVAMTDVQVRGGVLAHCAGGTCLRLKKFAFDGCLPPVSEKSP